MRRGTLLIVAASLALLIIGVLGLTLRESSPASAAPANEVELHDVPSEPPEPEPPPEIARSAVVQDSGRSTTTSQAWRNVTNVALGRLEVRVVWADSGAPCAGVEVTLVPFARGGLHYSSYARSGADGLAHFERVEAGPVHLMGDRSGNAEVRVVADGLTRAELRVARGCRVTGRVFAAPGALASQPQVWLYDSGSWRRVAEADDFRRFELEGVVPGSLLMARAREWSSRPARVQCSEGTVVELELMIELEGALILGQVLDLHEQPIEGAVVAVEMPEPPTQAFVNLAGKLYITTQTDDEGRFALAGHGAEQRLVVCAPHFAPYETRIDCSPTMRRIEHIVRLVEGALLLGRATFADGRPAENAFVSIGDLFEDELSVRFAITDAQGNYRLAGLPPGKHHVGVSFVFLGTDAGRAEADLTLQLVAPTVWNPVLE